MYYLCCTGTVLNMQKWEHDLFEPSNKKKQSLSMINRLIDFSAMHTLAGNSISCFLFPFFRNFVFVSFFTSYFFYDENFFIWVKAILCFQKSSNVCHA